MISSFEVLSRNQKLKGHQLLEASAGTGKTFAIENYVVRSLLETEEQLDQILVLTFTKAAASDLQSRIRNCIAQTSALLSSKKNPPDYLKAILEKDEVAVRLAQRYLRRALFSFENAQIFTFHGFCHKILSELSFLDTKQSLLSRTDIRRSVLDFFRTELDASYMHPAELNCLWRDKKTTEKVIEALEALITNGTNLAELPSFKEGAQHFCNVITEWQESTPFTSHHVLNDFLTLAKNYNKIFDRNNQLKPHFSHSMGRFSRMLEQEPSAQQFVQIIEDGLVWTDALNEENLRKKASPLDTSQLLYPNLDERVRQELAPRLSHHNEPAYLLVRLAVGARKLLSRYAEAEHRFTHDDLLRKMEKTVEDPHIAQQLREKYRIVIVDEFQDTDPIQWNILNKLFLDRPLNWDGRVVLVGDPKQSIYAFRQADIYTYLDAAQTLGQESAATLDTNFRSHPKLVDGLNKLFCSGLTPSLISLPAADTSIPCHPVKAGLHDTELSLLPTQEVGIDVIASAIPKKKKKILPEEEVFPFIAHEIHRLCKEYSVSPNHCAILVNDRYQGERLAKVLKEWNIPYNLHRSHSLTKSAAFEAIYELLVAIIFYRDLAIVKLALAGEILGWSSRQLLSLTDQNLLAHVLQLFAEWHLILSEQGIAACFQAVINTTYQNDPRYTHAEIILMREEGEQFFQDMLQVIELLLENSQQSLNSPEKIIDLFDELEELETNGDPSLTPRSFDSSQGASIVTIHSSKGLEYDIVFAIGVAERSKEPSQIIVKHTPEGRITLPIDVNSEEYLDHCAEIEAEKMRQFYVASTRAKYKLYLFLAAFTESMPKQPTLGTAAQIELFLSHLSGNGENIENLYKGIQELNLDKAKKLIEKIDPYQESIRYHELNPQSSQRPQSKANSLCDLSGFISPPPPPQFNFPAFHISSFTSLTSHLEKPKLHASTPQHLNDTLIQSPHTLPAGPETGIILHSLFEKIDFSKANDQSYLDRQLIKSIETSNLAQWKEILLTIVYATLSTNIEGFNLTQIDPQLSFRETEFLYSSEPTQLIKGVIDLFFNHQGKYYLIDWKSNWLGPDDSYYDSHHISKAMEEHNYYLQANFYKNALKKYTYLFDKRPFEEHFGGIYYLFLRGLPSGKGIYKLHQ